MKTWADSIDTSYEHKEACPRCRRNGRDRAGNNLHVYGEGKGAHCFSCGWTMPSADMLTGDEYEEEEVSTREPLTAEENTRIKGYSGTKSKGWRGIRDATNVPYGVRYTYDETTGAPDAQYVPTTVDGKLVGYKVRRFPKDFTGPVGVVGKETELIGQFRWPAGGKTLVIVGGEVDMLSAAQMLNDNQEARGYGDRDTFSVVAPTCGESSAFKQVQAQYKWLDLWTKIVVMMDNDDAGKEATEKIMRVLPRGKGFVATCPLKDPNECLVNGKEAQFVNAVWNARAYTPAGVVSAGDIYSEIVERSKQSKLAFPPMFGKLNDMLAGGITYGYIVNLLAGSGAGKSTVVNQCVAHWMVDCNTPVLVVSLEAEASEFGENLLSNYMGRKIATIREQEEKIAFVASDAAKQAAKDLFMFPEGKPRLYLLDDRGDHSKLQAQIEEVVVSCDVKVVVIDVLSDVLAGMSIEQVDLWLAWQKRFVKATNAILINVTHTRKGNGDGKAASEGKRLTEESILGSGSQYRSAGINIALSRDKTCEDDVERNTLKVDLLKNRSAGVTGPAGELYYDSETHCLHEKSEWLAAHGMGGF